MFTQTLITRKKRRLLEFFFLNYIYICIAYVNFCFLSPRTSTQYQMHWGFWIFIILINWISSSHGASPTSLVPFDWATLEESEENVNKLRTTQGRQRTPRDPYCWLGSLPGDKKAACNYVWPSIDINLLYLILLHSHIIILAKWSIINWPLNSMITQLYSKNCRT